VADWHLAQRLGRHGEGLTKGQEARTQLAAIETDRSLLAEPDPLVPVRQALAEALREELARAKDAVAKARSEARASLESAEGWSALAGAEREQILRSNDLLDPPASEVGSDDALAEALDRQPLSTWASQLRAVPTALDEALLELARRVEPKARPVRLPTRTLKTDDDVSSYVDEVRATLEAEVKTGPVVVS
jgi:hypothetical protein